MQNGLKISIPYKKLCYTVVKQELEPKELCNVNKGNVKMQKMTGIKVKSWCI